MYCTGSSLFGSGGAPSGPKPAWGGERDSAMMDGATEVRDAMVAVNRFVRDSMLARSADACPTHSPEHAQSHMPLKLT